MTDKQVEGVKALISAMKAIADAPSVLDGGSVMMCRRMAKKALDAMPSEIVEDV